MVNDITENTAANKLHTTLSRAMNQYGKIYFNIDSSLRIKNLWFKPKV
ncbi:MAG TPA: hypothetical protein P5132_04130 [Bacteroidales bacterium]|nr:hypothetical protein [Bacteroidales bacterium]